MVRFERIGHPAFDVLSAYQLERSSFSATFSNEYRVNCFIPLCHAPKNTVKRDALYTTTPSSSPPICSCVCELAASVRQWLGFASVGIAARGSALSQLLPLTNAGVG